MSHKYDAIIVGAGHNGLTTGEYLAKDYGSILGKLAKRDIPKDTQLMKSMIS